MSFTTPAPATFYEALHTILFMREATQWLEGNGNSVLGHFDRLLFPFYERDVREGRLTPGEARDLLRFLLAMSDARFGMRAGGHRVGTNTTVIIGGCDAAGEPVFNELTQMIVGIYTELRLVDPKLNARLSARHPADYVCSVAGDSPSCEGEPMAIGITREQALKLLNDHIQNPNMIKHCLAAEAVMAALADRLGQDRETWAMAGLLHDLDVEKTNADLNVHGLETVRILREAGVAPEIVDAIRMHNEQAHGQKRTTVFHHALACGETITGLIIATALVYPDKKLASVKAKSIVKRMKEPAFARSVNREIIRECEAAGVPLDEFAELALKAMQGISDTLGL